MLILSRKPGEAVLLDGGIRIVVLGSEGGAVRLGIEAPAAVGIVREEVAQRSAAASTPRPPNDPEPDVEAARGDA